METVAGEIPPRILGFYDQPFWRLLRDHRQLHLQKCTDCGTFRYPPGPVCHECLSPNAEWAPVAGTGEIISWVVFHRQYLPHYPAPYNVIALRLDEGPIFISNLAGEEPEGSWIGRRVRFVPVPFEDGEVLPRFVLA